MEFRLFRGTENSLGIPFRRTKREEHFWNFVVKHIAEENLLSILFAGTEDFRFESTLPNAAAENFKNSLQVCSLRTITKVCMPTFAFGHVVMQNSVKMVLYQTTNHQSCSKFAGKKNSIFILYGIFADPSLLSDFNILKCVLRVHACGVKGLNFVCLPRVLGQEISN
jgi:hypothetical protein